MLFRARSIVARHNIRNVIFFGASELKTLHFAFQGRDINLVVWHGTTKSRPKHDFIHRLVYSRVNVHVAISEHLGNNVRKIVPATDNVKYRVIYPSFRIDAKQALSRPAVHKKLRLVHIGRVAAGKGQVDAVKACQSLFTAGIDFELDLVGGAGDDDYARELRSAIDNSSCADRVNLHGFVEDTLPYLEQADIFLFPSYGEGMPNAFIEALHYGIPCLAYANTVFPEFISIGFNITLAADRDRHDLAEKLLAMATQIDEHRQTAAANATLARDYFDVQRELSSWQEILR
jgi:glycosyltransferase involved in cell wall biosynthesis